MADNNPGDGVLNPIVFFDLTLGGKLFLLSHPLSSLYFPFFDYVFLLSVDNPTM